MSRKLFNNNYKYRNRKKKNYIIRYANIIHVGNIRFGINKFLDILALSVDINRWIFYFRFLNLFIPGIIVASITNFITGIIVTGVNAFSSALLFYFVCNFLRINSTNRYNFMLFMNRRAILSCILSFIVSIIYIRLGIQYGAQILESMVN